MPARFRSLLFILSASALLLSPFGRAQELGATNAPGVAAKTAAIMPDVPAKASTITPGIPAKGATNATKSATLTTPKDEAEKCIASAVKKMDTYNLDGALADLNQAIKLNPESTGAYVLRAAIYCQKKQWPLAEADFKAAALIAPTNGVVKFNVVEVKFMQKQYDVARPQFLALETDPDVVKGDPEMVDFAAYKVFLCDLFGGHEDLARKELNVFNDRMGNPSYYFGNAAWSLVHKNTDDARSWLLSASRIYPPRKNVFYSQSLRDLGYLPIPEPAPAK